MSATLKAQESPPRLRDDRSTLGKALELTSRRTINGRIGARDRVWRGFAQPARNAWPRNLRRMAGAAAVAAGIFFAISSTRNHVDRWQLAASTGTVELENDSVWTPIAAGETLPIRAHLRVGGDGAAVLTQGPVRLALAPGTRLALDEKPSLEAGSCAVTISGEHRFRMAAGSYQIEAAGSPGAVFFAEVSATRVRVRAENCALQLGDAKENRLVAPGTDWSSGPADGAVASANPATHASDPIDPALKKSLAELLGDAAVSSHEQLRAVALYRPAPAPAADEGALLFTQAHAAEGVQDYSAAASLYSQLAERDARRAPTALYELARVRLRFLKQPEAALAALEEERQKFPDGPLAQEVALSAIEARLALGEDAASVREMNGFLETFSESERAPEVRWLRASLELKAACSAARSDLAALVPDPLFGGDALFAQANCARRAGDRSAARLELHEYLRRFPSGPHHREAESMLAASTETP